MSDKFDEFNVKSAWDAMGTLMRKLPEASGSVPYYSLGSAISVHPSGVLLACTHTVMNFVNSVGPFDSDHATALYKLGKKIPAEPSEKL